METREAVTRHVVNVHFLVVSYPFRAVFENEGAQLTMFGKGFSTKGFMNLPMC